MEVATTSDRTLNDDDMPYPLKRRSFARDQVAIVGQVDRESQSSPYQD
jgi:hypothetical protein